MNWIVRDERAAEAPAIRALIGRAFADNSHSDGNEARIVERLRADGDLALSQVVVDDERIVGHAAWSAARLSDDSEGWIVLGPIAVEPSHQGRGIGRALVEAGETMLRRRGANGLVVLGDPKLYARFGFVSRTAIRLDGEPGEYLQVKSFGTPVPAARIRFARAFE